MKIFRAFLVMGLIFLGTGCSTFQRDWKKSSAADQKGIEGPWQGQWKSDANGHSGRLLCLIRQTDATHYEARFHATYQKVVTFTYTATLEGTNGNGRAILSGSANLGWLAGGVYSYQAEVTPTHFQSTYTSKYDHGLFEMNRP